MWWFLYGFYIAFSVGFGILNVIAYFAYMDPTVGWCAHVVNGLTAFVYGWMWPWLLGNAYT